MGHEVLETQWGLHNKLILWINVDIWFELLHIILRLMHFNIF